jgi:hypothetical protein
MILKKKNQTKAFLDIYHGPEYLLLGMKNVSKNLIFQQSTFEGPLFDL